MASLTWGILLRWLNSRTSPSIWSSILKEPAWAHTEGTMIQVFQCWAAHCTVSSGQAQKWQSFTWPNSLVRSKSQSQFKFKWRGNRVYLWLVHTMRSWGHAHRMREIVMIIFANIFPRFSFDLEHCLFVELVNMPNIYHAVFVVSCYMEKLLFQSK